MNWGWKKITTRLIRDFFILFEILLYIQRFCARDPYLHTHGGGYMWFKYDEERAQSVRRIFLLLIWHMLCALCADDRGDQGAQAEGDPQHAPLPQGYVCMYVCIFIYIYWCVNIYYSVCVRACVCVCVCVCCENVTCCAGETSILLAREHNN